MTRVAMSTMWTPVTLLEIGDGARGAGVDLDDVELALVDEVLYVHQPARAEGEGQAAGAVRDVRRHLGREALGRVDGDGVAGVDARALDVLHDAGDEHALAVGDDVALQLRAGHVLVHEHGVGDAAGEDDAHVAAHVGLLVGDDHVLAADDVGGAQQHGIAQPLRGRQRLLQRVHAGAARALYAHGAEQRVELLAVLGEVYALGGGAEDLHALGDEEVRQRYGRLPAEGHDDADGLFHLDDAHDVLGAERLEVEAGGGVVVRGDRLGVVVDDDDVVAHLAQGLHAVDGAVIELYALADADGAGAEDDDRLAALGALGAGVAAALGHGVEIGRAGLELGGAGVDHLVGERRALGRLAAGDAADGGVRVAEAAGGLVVFRGEPGGEGVFELLHALELAQEPLVDAGHVVQGLHGVAGLERLEEGEYAHVVHVALCAG